MDRKEYIKQWTKNNRDKRRIIERRYKEKNIEKVRSWYRNWYKKNSKKKMSWNSRYLDSNINARLAFNLRTRVRKLLERDTKTGSAVRDLGCSVKELKSYLEIRFTKGMSWDNFGEWQIDHIKPLSLFDLQDREQFLKAVHYTNLQPLWKLENLSKGNKYEEKRT